MSASEFIADLVARDDLLVEIGAEEIAELERRWTAVGQGEPLIALADVCRWLRTWGTPGYKSWSSV